ncbi:MAG: bifunctional alpha/beta hydrolase/OsmC family protein [Parvularculaceae bacterium]
MPERTMKAEFGGSAGKLAAALELPNGTPRAFALFAHCFSCTKDVKSAKEIAKALRAQGFGVLRFDFTGLGNSEGDFANTNFSSNVEDLVKAAEFLRRELAAPAILVGHSLGGAAAIVAARAVPEVRAVAVVNAPADATHVLKHIGEAKSEIEAKGAAQVMLAGRPFTMKKQFLDDLQKQSVVEAVAELKRPLLILHGPRDETVGVENATKLFLAAKHPKSFVSLDRADHLLTNLADARYAGEMIAAWASRYVEAPAPAAPEIERADFLDGGEATMLKERRYAVAVAAGGHPAIVDVDREDGGDGLGPNPTRLVEAALAACSAITIRMYAERKGWTIDALKVSVVRAETSDAHLSRALDKTIELAGPLDEAQREKLHDIASRCPVHRMLSEGVAISSRLA